MTPPLWTPELEDLAMRRARARTDKIEAEARISVLHAQRMEREESARLATESVRDVEPPGVEAPMSADAGTDWRAERRRIALGRLEPFLGQALARAAFEVAPRGVLAHDAARALGVILADLEIELSVSM